ncbi:GNAT family N-acetyltransferase [Luteipulveratus mongoliensis]|uniref:GNAT family N-acetyltransferase n=1 Tax=Luteipulveratus mongoliensis TaxID=571913 RepID=UPI0006962DCD|nr:GNAT family N-acetyltransferase [Luteipulveratus mongoliensis]
MTLTITSHLGLASPPDGALDVLTDAFAEPPYGYDRARFERRLEQWSSYAEVPGFRTVTAHRDGQLVGIAWGWNSGVGSCAGLPGYRELYTRLEAKPWGSELRGVEVVELGVARSERGTGVGRQLLDRLVSGGPGWLIAYAEAPAAQWYAQRGWRRLGPLEGEPPLLVFAAPE